MAGVYLITFLLSLSYVFGANIYVDTGNPYAVGKLETGELTLTKSTDNSPKHCKVYFPLEPGEYATVYFVGGLSSLVLAEFYSIVLRKIAEHGFFVFAIDYDFPVQLGGDDGTDIGQDLNIYFEQLEFFKKFVKTQSTPRYDRMGLLCHSAGCDVTLKMIEDGRVRFNSTSFLEPYSSVIRKPLKINNVPGLMYGTELSEKGVTRCNVPGYDYKQFYSVWKCPRIAIEVASTGFLEPYSSLVRAPLKIINVPGLMYGTELAEKGVTRCNVPGYDYKQFYSVWKCPRIAIEVANYGHCDFLDPVPYEGCRVSHFCTTRPMNTTEQNHYRETVQGIVTSFFMTTLQGRPDAVNYIADEAKVPLKLLVDQSDLNCLQKKKH